MKVTDYDERKLEFKKSLETRDFEISNFWKRSWFFGALLIAIASGYYVLKSDPMSTMPPIILSFIGFLVSLAQSLMNRGSKYWQERWEFKTSNRESALGIDVTNTERYNDNEKSYIELCILNKNENALCRSSRWSVSKLTILVWDIITISCFLIWINDIIGYIPNLIYMNIMLKILIFHSIIFIYISLFSYKSNIHRKLGEHHSIANNIANRYTHDNFKEP